MYNGAVAAWRPQFIYESRTEGVLLYNVGLDLQQILN